MKTMPAPIRAQTARSSSITWFVMTTSSAVVGSSAMISDGSQQIAMAIMTRCRMPPDSSWGYCAATRTGSGRPTEANRSVARALAQARDSRRCVCSASVTWSPQVISGLRAVCGSWKT
jgi:hypothetical protein